MVVGKVHPLLEEERPNERMGLQIASHNESELAKCGTDLMMTKVKVSGSEVAGLVGSRGKWGSTCATCSCLGQDGHLRNQGAARRIASLGLVRKEDDLQ